MGLQSSSSSLQREARCCVRICVNLPQLNPNLSPNLPHLQLVHHTQPPPPPAIPQVSSAEPNPKPCPTYPAGAPDAEQHAADGVPRHPETYPL